jgi:hypothetical protein
MRQAVANLESGGAAVAGAQCRIKLAAALRTLGRHAEALYTLPAEETLPPSARRSLLAERAELHLAAGRPREAAADARALLAIWQSEPPPPSAEIAAAAAEPLARQAAGRPREAAADDAAPLALRQSEPLPPSAEIAVAQGLLARACLEAGNPGEAEPLARHATGVLAEWGHPDAAGCRITLALAAREPSRAVFEDALRMIESAPFLSAAEKARRLEAESARIDRCGPIEGVIAMESPVQLAGD